MDNEKFVKSVGELHIPEESWLTGDDIIQCAVIFGFELAGVFMVTIPDSLQNHFLDRISLVESRGAVRGDDYIISCRLDGGLLILTLHTKKCFFSIEDANDEVDIVVS